MTDTPNFEGTHLFNRLVWAKDNLDKVQSQYCIVWETPYQKEDEACKITTPDPNWMAAALSGGILPDIQSYLEDKETIAAYVAKYGSQAGFEWKKQGGANHPYTAPIGAMSEEQAIEYLIQKDIENEVWMPRHNRQIMKIVKRSAIPTDRTYRNSWRIDSPELEAA